MKRVLILAAMALLVWSCAGAGDSESGDDDAQPTNDIRQGTDVPVNKDTGTPDVVEETDTGGGEPDDVIPLDQPGPGEDVDAIGDVPPADDTDISIDPDAGDGSSDPDVDDDTEPPPPTETYFKSAELGIKILGPSATGEAQALGSFIQVAGLVVGKPDAIIWESETTGQSGYADGMPFFLSGKVDLDQGDNVIIVTAMQGDEEATDRIVITHNPAFLFGGELLLRPSAAFVGSQTSMCFNLNMGLYANFEPNTLKLCECTEDGVCVSDMMTLVDDGQVNSSCDEVGEDSIYSGKDSYTFTEPGKKCFRAHVVVKAGYQQYTAFTPVACLEVVEHVTKEECQDVQAVQQDADQLYYDTIAAGSDPGTARQAVIAYLLEQPSVEGAGPSYQGYGVWARYDNGLLGAFNFNAEGMRGGENDEEDDYDQGAAPLGMQEIRIASKRSTVLSPFHDEIAEQDEGTFAFNLLDKSECPAFVLDGPFYNTQVKLKLLRSMYEYGIIALTGHGDSYFKQLSDEAKDEFDWTHRKSQELVWTGEEVDCDQLVQSTPTCSGSNCPTGSECVLTQASVTSTSVSGICIDFKQVDLRRGRIAMGPDRYGILPSFIGRYRGTGYPESLVYLGTCRSLWNGTMGMELFGAGAKAVVGYSGYVSSSFAFQQGTEFLSALIEEMKLTGAALPDTSVEDPANPGTNLRLLGAPNLNATNADLINPSWESGDITGWQKTGDGRVVSRLGITVPVEGKFMGLISTGMGFTPQVGELYQTFCVPEDKFEMSFYWKFYSEEFKEWCGSSYQDTFQGTLEGDEGMITFVDANVDALCPPEECFGCGGQYDGLIQSDVIFDQGGVWNTHWRKASNNVQALAGAGAVTLRFFSTDMGDSIYDTVILLDTIKFD